jgi:hypothetical protein
MKVPPVSENFGLASSFYSQEVGRLNQKPDLPDEQRRSLVKISVRIMRWTSPDPIIPGVGEGGNADAVGCLGAANYSPLTVDYHENQLLEQLNHENRARLQDPDFRLPPVPTNSIAFDRYAYSLNNPIRYTDPSGHCPLCAAVALTLGAVTPVGWVVIGVAMVATVAFIATGGPEAFGEALYQGGEAVSNGLEAVFASKYTGDPRTAGDIIGQEKQGRIKGEFPSDLLGKTYDEIADLAKHGKGAIRDKARTAKKLLDSNEYDKKEKR